MHKYQSLAAWRRAHSFALLVLRTLDQHYAPRARPLFDQIRRAAISVEANIVEGYALGTPRQFRRHLRIALGSAAEAESLLRLGGELRYVPETPTNEMLELIGEVIATIFGLLRKPLVVRGR